MSMCVSIWVCMCMSVCVVRNKQGRIREADSWHVKWKMVQSTVDSTCCLTSLFLPARDCLLQPCPACSMFFFENVVASPITSTI